MSATDTMKWMGKSARSRAQAVGHSMKDRGMERRLDRTTDEADRLRFENDRLREEVERTRGQSERMLELIERRLSETAESAEGNGKRSHKGRWLMLLVALGGGAYAVIRSRSSAGRHEWSDVPSVTESSAATL
jgi:hypothetical protein